MKLIFLPVKLKGYMLKVKLFLKATATRIAIALISARKTTSQKTYRFEAFLFMQP
jgi:hypothetical protein